MEITDEFMESLKNYYNDTDRINEIKPKILKLIRGDIFKLFNNDVIKKHGVLGIKCISKLAHMALEHEGGYKSTIPDGDYLITNPILINLVLLNDKGIWLCNKVKKFDKIGRLSKENINRIKAHLGSYKSDALKELFRRTDHNIFIGKELYESSIVCAGINENLPKSEDLECAVYDYYKAGECAGKMFYSLSKTEEDYIRRWACNPRFDGKKNTLIQWAHRWGNANSKNIPLIDRLKNIKPKLMHYMIIDKAACFANIGFAYYNLVKITNLARDFYCASSNIKKAKDMFTEYRLGEKYGVLAKMISNTYYSLEKMNKKKHFNKNNSNYHPPRNSG